MRHNVGLMALVATSLFIAAVPVIYHDVPAGQDPYAHLVYAKEILEGRGISTDTPWIHATGLDSFPLFHILFAALRVLTGFGDWGVYSLLMVALPTLTILFLYLIGETLFDRQVGLLAGSYTALSFFFISHLYNIGLTYNLLMVLLGLMSLYFVFSGRERDAAITVFPLAASHVMSVVFLVPVLVMSWGRNRVAWASGAALLYPLGFLAGRALSGATLEITAPRNPLGVYLSYVKAVGWGTVFGVAVFAAFLLAALYLGIRKKGAYQKVMIWTCVVLLAWFLVSLPFMGPRGLGLYETDRFLFYGVFPLALAGAAACYEVEGRYRKALVAVVLLVSLLSAQALVDHNVRVPYAVENSMVALDVLSRAVAEDDMVAATEVQWVSYYAGCQVAKPMVGGDGYSASLLQSPDILYGFSPEDVFGFMNASEKRPRYVFLGYNDYRLEWPVVEWFILNSGPEERFDIAYFDEGSMIVRPVYYDREYALSWALATARGPVEVAIVDSFDAYTIVPGEESWLVRMQVAGEIYRYVVSKETGEAAPWQ